MLLCISLSSTIAKVGLCSDNHVVSEQVMTGATNHSACFFQCLDVALQEAGITKEDITALAVDIGPGSFIGARSAVVIAQGIMLHRKLPAQTLCSLEILYEQALTPPQESIPRWVLTAQDARMGQWYYALWDSNTHHAIIEPGVAEPAYIYQQIEALNIGEYSTIGSAFDADHALCVQAMCRLAKRHNQWTTDSMQVKPLYIRNQVATPSHNAP